MSLRDLIRLLKTFFTFKWSDRVARAKITPTTLLLVRVDAIGDYILFRNFLPVIRKYYADYRITLCGNEAWKELAETYDCSYVDDFIWVNMSSFYNDLPYRKNVLSDVATRGFEVALQPTYSRRLFLGDAIVKASGAPTRIGSQGDMSNELLKIFKRIGDSYYTHLVPAEENILFEFNRNAEFLSNLLKEDLDVPLFLQARKDTRDKYVVLFPGASLPERKWSAAYFGLVAAYIKGQGRRIVIVGSSDDSAAAASIIEVAGAEMITDMTGQTNLVDFCSIIATAGLVVTTLSSAVHIAAATHTPTICIFVDYQLGRFAPYPKKQYPQLEFITTEEQLNKSINGDHLRMSYGNFMKQLDIQVVTPETVIQKVAEYL